MKITLITLSGLLFVVLISYAFMKKSIRDTEQHNYIVLKSFDQVEIRQYESAIFSSVKIAASNYKTTSGQGFRTLAGYIFGSNENNEKIAMTSPVMMEFGEESKMSFMVPSEYKMEDLPAPKDKNIIFEHVPVRVVAALTFSGWANDQKIEQYSHLLLSELKKEGIETIGKIQFLGYNPPYDLVDRKNEVIVEVKWD